MRPVNNDAVAETAASVWKVQDSWEGTSRRGIHSGDGHGDVGVRRERGRGLKEQRLPVGRQGRSARDARGHPRFAVIAHPVVIASEKVIHGWSPPDHVGGTRRSGLRYGTVASGRRRRPRSSWSSCRRRREAAGAPYRYRPLLPRRGQVTVGPAAGRRSPACRVVALRRQVAHRRTTCRPRPPPGSRRGGLPPRGRLAVNVTVASRVPSMLHSDPVWVPSLPVPL